VNAVKEEHTRSGAPRAFGYAAGLGVLAALGLLVARVKAYFLMVDDLEATRANISRAERAAAEIKSARDAKRPRTTAGL
jgi:hypothetical protein